MAMLAEPRRKQKWSLNPRGKHWSEDSNKFGQKMLEKMGWTSGKGLGANLDGMTEHIRARYKNDQGGIGFSNDDAEKQWTQHQESYNELLQKLQNGEMAETSAKENELSGKSLELKSKQSRARVHYQKFTRGKDVNKYSTKDLANIFGKKDLDEKSELPVLSRIEFKEEREESITEPVGSSESSHGVVTIRGGSITDYFKNKISSLCRKNVNDVTREAENLSESDDDRYTGFGFAGTRDKIEKSRKNENYTFENSAHVNDAPREISVTTGKRKSDYIFENSALELGDSPRELERTPKRRKSEFIFENGGLELESPVIDEKTPKSRVKGEKIEIFEPTGKTEETLTSTDCVETIGKKKRRKKSKECCPSVAEGFTNEALNLEIRDIVVDDDANVNDEGSSKVGQFEVPRLRFGLANDALDLTDESSGKKRVTFSETIEYETNVGKVRGKKMRSKSAAAKLDKFEVDNEKLRKKRKKEKRTYGEIVTIDGGFANVAMDVDIVSQEASDNAVNERKIERARRKSERRVSSLSTIEEATEEDKEESTIITGVAKLDESLVGETSENLEILSLDTPKQMRKRRKKRTIEETSSLERENSSSTIDDNELIEEIEIDGRIEERRSTKLLDGENSEREKTRNSMRCIEPVIIVNFEDTVERSKKCKKESTKREAKMIQEIEEMDESVQPEKEEKTKRRVKEKSRESMDKENVRGIFDDMEIIENTKIVESEKKRKKRKRDKRRNSNDIEDTEESKDVRSNENLTEDDTAAREKSMEDEWCGEVASCHVELQNGSRSPWDSKVKKSKTIFKALFARSPVVHFAGSNINDIKGYGMDFA